MDEEELGSLMLKFTHFICISVPLTIFIMIITV